MEDSTEKMEPPADTSWATFENPNKPRIYPKRPVSARHRVDPMRPANPRPAEIVGHYLQEHPDPPRTDTERKGPNLFLGLILFVVGLIGIGIVLAIFAGLTWLMLFLTGNIS